MHREAMNEMVRILEGIEISEARVLDVGSLDVNGSYRDVIELAGGTYVGLDIQDGENVTVVTRDPYNFPFPDDMFHMVISGSVMEHVEAPWLWFPELFRVVRPGGAVIILTHMSWEYHPYPVDCWRIMPDGFKFLARTVDPNMVCEIRMYNDTDISFQGIKSIKKEEG
jgi:SAM-dependent methyltransferase